jgi:mRNA-degrading endonuclease RelE of RelBE toxin-antitoxin system
MKMIYERFYVYSAKKELYKLDHSIILQILKKLKELDSNIELGKPLSNILKNIRSLHIGDYGIIYLIKEKEKKIIIIKICHRKNIYSLISNYDFENINRFNSLVKSSKQKIFYEKIKTIEKNSSDFKKKDNK